MITMAQGGKETKNKKIQGRKGKGMGTRGVTVKSVNKEVK